MSKKKKKKTVNGYGWPDELYAKVGGKYISVTDPWAYTGLRDGDWLVRVRPGTVSIRKPIWPDKEGMSAAAELFREAMEQALFEALKFKPREPLTKKQAALWRQLEEAGIHLPWQPSVYEVVEAGLRALKV